MSADQLSDHLSSLFNSLAVLLSANTAGTEHLQRVTVLAQLCQCWTAGHDIKLICTAESHEPLPIAPYKFDSVRAVAVTVTCKVTEDRSLLSVPAIAASSESCSSPDTDCIEGKVLGKQKCEKLSADFGVARTLSLSGRRAEDSDTDISDTLSDNTVPADDEECIEPTVSDVTTSKSSASNKHHLPTPLTEQASIPVKKRGRPKKQIDSATKQTEQNSTGSLCKLPYCCSTCGRRFRNRPCLKLHILTHTGERPYACRHPGCDKRFAQPGTRVGHEQTHSSSPPRFICVLCGRTYRSNRALREHIRDLHNESAPTAPQHCCAKCGRMFLTVKALKRHNRRTHLDNLRYSCDMCPKQFKTLTLLKRHQMALHSDVRPWSCAICDKTFSQAANMRTHMRVHTGEKPFVCSVCGGRFAHSGTLKGHMVTHRGKESKEV